MKYKASLFYIASGESVLYGGILSQQNKDLIYNRHIFCLSCYKKQTKPTKPLGNMYPSNNLHFVLCLMIIFVDF